MTLPRLATIWLAAGALLIALYFVLPRAGTGQSALYLLIGLASAMLAVPGIRTPGRCATRGASCGTAAARW